MTNRINKKSKRSKQSVQLIAQIGTFPLKIDAVALAPDETTLAVATGGSEISVWDLRNSTQISVLDIPEEALHQPDPQAFGASPNVPTLVQDLVFSHDGVFIAAALTTHEVGIWIQEGMLVETIKRRVGSLAFLPTSDLLVLCLKDGHIELWEIAPARKISSFVGLPDPTDGMMTSTNLSRCAVACSSDGAQLAVIYTFYENESGRVRSNIQIWDVAQQNERGGPTLQKTIKGPDDFLDRGIYLQKQHILFCSAPYSSCWGMNTDTGETIVFLPEDSWRMTVRAYAISPNRKLIAIARSDGEVVIRHVQDQRICAQFQAHETVKQEVDATSAILWFSDGERLLTIGTTRDEKKRSGINTIKLWQLTL